MTKDEFIFQIREITESEITPDAYKNWALGEMFDLFITKEKHYREAIEQYQKFINNMLKVVHTE